MIATALQFGGGKDSLACLYLLREEWDSILVTWMNTGAAFPETIEQMRGIAKMVPHFMEVRADVLSDHEIRGWPVDVLPISHSEFGRMSSGEREPKLRAWSDCCSANFWFPLHEAMVERGIKKIIRGQRLSEKYKSPIRSGHVVDGIIYEFPLENWTEQQVFDFLKRNGVEIPAYYSELESSLDCWSCTAYLDVKDRQIDYLRKNHPEKYKIVRQRLAKIAEATEDALSPLARYL